MWKIGGLRIDGQVVLGPMSGVTSESYRKFMKPFGTAVSVTEMTSDTGVLHNLTKTKDFIDFDQSYPTGLQLFGSDPEILAKAAEKALKINPNIDFFDVNMGCPVSKVFNAGSGSALMGNPEKCGSIIRHIKKATDVPVTAKIRLGIDANNINFREVIDKLTDADVDAIALHARVREELYAGTPHYDLVGDLRSDMSVPLIISGNIYSPEDAIRAMNLTGADAVMVARGGVGNPFLITQINHCLSTGEVLPNPTISQQIDWCMSLADALISEKGDDVAIRRLRSFAPKFIAGCHRCRAYRHRLASEITDRKSLESLLEEVRLKMGYERIYTEGRSTQICQDFQKECGFS